MHDTVRKYSIVISNIMRRHPDEYVGNGSYVPDSLSMEIFAILDEILK